LKGTQRELHTKKPDLDNLQKAVFDALPFDDSIIHTCFSQKVYAAKEEEPHIIMIHGEQYQHCIMKMFKCLSVHMRKSVQ
jgi:Holliday junction resolvase RusA-like endonuclease